MNMSAEKIYEKVKALQKERDELTRHIKQLNQTIEATKKAVHRTEAQIALEGAVTNLAGVPDFHLANDFRELKKEKNSLQSDTGTIKDLSSKLQALNHEIEQDTFWLHYADSSDASRQHEAERRVFG